MDVREMVLGSEGRLGVVTQAKVRVRRLHEVESFFGVFFPSWEQGSDAVREIVQSELPVSMLRLSNPLETETTLILSGKSWAGMANRGLRTIGYGDERCLLVFGVTGSRKLFNRTRADVGVVCRKHGGLVVGTIVGNTWEKNRFLSPYLRNTLWEKGVAIDTLETAKVILPRSLFFLLAAPPCQNPIPPRQAGAVKNICAIIAHPFPPRGKQSNRRRK